MDEFSVVQFLADETYEYVRRWVAAEEAGTVAKHYTESVGAQIGTTRRVIITDGWDFCCFEWRFGEGVTYSPRGPDGRFVADLEGSSKGESAK